MLPLADTHVHLLAGLDDGPATRDEAVEMCRLLHRQGVRHVSALAHQNETFPDVTPDTIRHAAQVLERDLAEAGIELAIYPTAEVMIVPDLEDHLADGRFLTCNDLGRYLLIELPHDLYIDLGGTVRSLMRQGIRPILAHPERTPEMLHQPGEIEELIALGCLVQVSARSFLRPKSPDDFRAIRSWFDRGVVHLLCSDAHGIKRRVPRMDEAMDLLRSWVGEGELARIVSDNGIAVFRGGVVNAALPRPATARKRFFQLW